jgi:hypothetical protein
VAHQDQRADNVAHLVVQEGSRLDREIQRLAGTLQVGPVERFEWVLIGDLNLERRVGVARDQNRFEGA